MNKLNQLLLLIRCPKCFSDNLVLDKTIKCKECFSDYPLTYNRPILLKSENNVFNIENYINISNPEFISNNKKRISFFPTPSVNLNSIRVLNEMKCKLKNINEVKILVVGSGTQRNWLNNFFGYSIIYTDIDINADVDIFCDGHDLPFKNEIFDAVITTAVLEHVLYPEMVASEIYRVLKTNGLLYSEIPFMQQVHEGAYDFTRYTLSGHRRLFNGFFEIESGMVAGPGTSLVWAIENFTIAFFSNSKIRKLTKAITRLLFFWIKYFDYLFDKKIQATDGASCTYFFGSKSLIQISDLEIINKYRGAIHLSHT